MTRLSDLLQITKADESVAEPPDAQASLWLAYLKIMLAGGDLIGAERCETASPPRATAGQ